MLVIDVPAEFKHLALKGDSGPARSGGCGQRSLPPRATALDGVHPAPMAERELASSASAALPRAVVSHYERDPLKARLSLVPAPLQFLVLLVAGSFQRAQALQIEYLLTENRVLRERLGPKRFRLTDPERRRLAERAHVLGRRLLDGLSVLATPETILGWYRKLIAQKYDGVAKRRGSGRPRAHAKAIAQLLTMARENPTWGYTRLRGALANIGYQLGRGTIERALAEHGIEPAPRRGRTMSWKTFLAAHAGAIASADFFTVEVLTRGGLVRYMVFFVMNLRNRRVHIAAIAPAPNISMVQVARNLTDAYDGFLNGIRHLILDRDPLYSAQFLSLLRDSGVEPLRLPSRSPNLNAHAERFVRSIKTECLAKVIPLGEAHLRSLIREYVDHYHEERNHQGLDNRIPFPRDAPVANADVRRRDRIGGLLRYYYRDAA